MLRNTTIELINRFLEIIVGYNFGNAQLEESILRFLRQNFRGTAYEKLQKSLKL